MTSDDLRVALRQLFDDLYPLLHGRVFGEFQHALYYAFVGGDQDIFLLQFLDAPDGAVVAHDDHAAAPGARFDLPVEVAVVSHGRGQWPHPHFLADDGEDIRVLVGEIHSSGLHDISEVLEVLRHDHLELPVRFPGEVSHHAFRPL